jgi:hypothetical protein
MGRPYRDAKSGVDTIGLYRKRLMKKISLILLLFVPMLAGCQWLMLTVGVLVYGTDAKPKYDILQKGSMRVAVVPRSNYSSAYELQNAPRDIARQVNYLLDTNVRNKALRVVDQSKIEAWLDNCDNDFDDFVEVGRASSIKADIVIGFDIIRFQIRDPQNAHLIQGKCTVQVQAIDCATGKVLASETLTIVDPPNMPMDGNPVREAQFRPLFLGVVAQHISSLFHHHDPHRVRRIDADSLEIHRY